MPTPSAETCENCGKLIGTLETAHLWKDHIVCAECRQALPKNVSPPKDVAPRTVLAVPTLLGKTDLFGDLRSAAAAISSATASHGTTAQTRPLLPLQSKTPPPYDSSATLSATPVTPCQRRESSPALDIRLISDKLISNERPPSGSEAGARGTRRILPCVFGFRGRQGVSQEDAVHSRCRR